MTLGPIEKRLRECTDTDETSAGRAGRLLRALPQPAPISEAARRRVLWALGASSRKGHTAPFTTLQWALFSVLLVSTAAASAKRIWFPNWLHRHPAVAESAGDPAVLSPPPATWLPSKPAPTELEGAPLAEAASPAPSSRARSSSPARPEPVRPRLLSDPQLDAIPRVLPKLVYDAELYSVLLDVCVSSQGRVTKVSIVRGQEATLDRQISDAVRRWNYLPAEANGKPVAMCFPLVYRIQAQRD